MGQKAADQNTVSLRAEFVYSGIDEPVCMMIPAGDFAGTYFYFYDGLGSVRALVDAGTGDIVEGYTYNVFGWHSVNYTAGPDGNWLTPDGYTSGYSQYGNPYLFTGRQWDGETGLYYYRARMYSPFLGRFMQTDPIGYADSMNLYQYCLNNPVNWIDPWGLQGGTMDSLSSNPQTVMDASEMLGTSKDALLQGERLLRPHINTGPIPWYKKIPIIGTIVAKILQHVLPKPLPETTPADPTPADPTPADPTPADPTSTAPKPFTMDYSKSPFYGLTEEEKTRMLKGKPPIYWKNDIGTPWNELSPLEQMDVWMFHGQWKDYLSSL